MQGLFIGLLCGQAIWACAQTLPVPVAVFEEERFPQILTEDDVTPKLIRSLLFAAGIRSEAVNVEALSDPERFNAQKFKVLVWVNGSAFPRAASENLRRFHAMGGCLVVTGIPFSQPCEIPGIASVPRWTVAAPGKSIVRVRQGEAHTGQFSAFVHKRGGEWAGIASSRLACEPGRGYLLSAWVKTDNLGGPGNRISLRFYDACGNGIGEVSFPLPGKADQWTRIGQEIKAPGDAGAMDVCLQAATEKGTLQVDDVLLCSSDQARPGDPEPRSWVPDAGFELFAKAGWRSRGPSEEYLGHDQIGTGESQTIYDCTGFLPSGRDPVGLKFLKWPKPARAHIAQYLDPSSLPKEDVVTGLVAALRGKEIAGYPVALIDHNCAQFRGATDVWIGPRHGGLLRRPKAEQMILLSVAYLLSERGLLPRAVYRHVVRFARNLPIPKPQERLARRYKLVTGQSPYPTVYPRSRPPERELQVINVSLQPLPVKLSIAVLQGLVNREKPLIYIEDEWWSGLKALGFSERRVFDPYELIARFKEKVKGLILYDPDFPATLNVALTMAGLRDALPASPDLAEKLRGRFGFEILEDLRGRWKTESEAYRWAFENLLPKCNHFLLGHQKQAEPLAPEDAGPAAAAIAVDYFVQHQAFVFHLNRRPMPEELGVADDILGALPPNIPVMGRTGPHPTLDPDTIAEWDLVSRISGFGKFFLYGIPPNLSVHSGIEAPASLTQSPLRKLSLEKDKVYVSFLCSEGDSLWFWYGMQARANGWGNPGRGKVPVGWGITPALLDLAPAILKHHYRTASPLDCFFAPVSGMGLAYPEIYGMRYDKPQGILEGFLKLTARYMKQMDLKIIRPHQAGGTTDATYNRYAKELEGLSALFPDYGRRSGFDYANANYTLESGIPVFHCLTSAQNVDGIAREIRSVVGKNRPAFVHAFLWGWIGSPEDLFKVAEKLGPEFILVRPDELVALFKEAQGGQVQSPTPP